MSLHVNLLLESERRYQGPVSMRFAMVVVGSVTGALLLLFLGVATYRHFALRASMRTAQNDWQQIEARYNQITAQQKDLAANQALMGELGLWTKIRPEWSKLLPGLQKAVPASVQLTRLTVRGEWQYIKPPAPPVAPPPEGGAAQEGGAASAAKAPKERAAIPARKFFVGTEGRAQGELADETVVQFVRTLRDAGGFKPLFEAVKLQRLTRDAGATEAQADRLFEVQGEFFARKLE